MVAMPVCTWRLRQDDLLSAEVRSGQHGEVPEAPLKHPRPQIPHIIVRPGRSLTVGPGAICPADGETGSSFIRFTCTHEAPVV